MFHPVKTQVEKYFSSEKGQSDMLLALKAAQEAVERLQKERQVTTEMLNEPMTL